MSARCLSQLVLAQNTHVRPQANIRQEIETAVSDLCQHNVFDPRWVMVDGPYQLMMGMEAGRLHLSLSVPPASEPVWEQTYGLSRLMPAIRDYFLAYQALQHASDTTPYQLETLDMARRAQHDAGSMALAAMLAADIAMDYATARRLFTLVAALQLGQRREGLGGA